VMRQSGTLKATVSAEAATGNGSHKEVPPQVPAPAVAPSPAAAAPPVTTTTSPAAAVLPSVSAPATSRPPVDASARDDIDALLKDLVAEEGSDLHLRVGEPPLIRLHGELKRMDGRAKLVAPQVEAMLGAIMPDRNYTEYRDTNDTDFAYEIDGVARFRANAFRDHHGAGGVFRVIPAKVATVEELGITPEVQKLCFLTKGLVLVTGPTGSGKSTTLGGLIDLINRSRNDHVITIEDPIEFVHVNKKCVITQRQVGLHTGSFKHALRAALREDPDVVLIGELRDLETISIAIETAETGHLVFGTLHTTTAVGTIDRVIDQFPADRQEQIRVMLADSLKGVISQTLCKRIGGGRVAAREILLTIPAVSNLIREGKAFQIPSVMQTSRKLGMIQLGDVLIDLVDQGMVEPQEAYTKATDKNAFMAMLKNRGLELAPMSA
jgi:twitching motility protein PilT